MPSYQRVFVMGHLGRDPEVRFLTNGNPVANFSIAVGEKWKDRDGKPQEHTEWFNVVVYGMQAAAPAVPDSGNMAGLTVIHASGVHTTL